MEPFPKSSVLNIYLLSNTNREAVACNMKIKSYGL
jgi:hypothetical protein